MSERCDHRVTLEAYEDAEYGASVRCPKCRRRIDMSDVTIHGASTEEVPGVKVIALTPTRVVSLYESGPIVSADGARVGSIGVRGLASHVPPTVSVKL